MTLHVKTYSVTKYAITVAVKQWFCGITESVCFIGTGIKFSVSKLLIDCVSIPKQLQPHHTKQKVLGGSTNYQVPRFPPHSLII